MKLGYQDGRERYAGYDKIMGNISWLLIALVSLDIKLIPLDATSTRFLTVFCILLLLYNIMARYLVFSRKSSQIKTFIDLMVFLCFIVAVSWFTGRETSPFISLMYLILMATSLTQGKRVTYFMAALAISSYVLLAAEEASFLLYRHTFVSHILELFPFMLIAHLGAMLSGEAESARKEIERLSQTDEITGLHNMRNFFHLAEFHEKTAMRYGKNYALCMLDADNLKQINDRYGHFAGTELIKHVGANIARTIRSSDVAARYGGDEFIILFPESSKEEVREAVTRILRSVEGSHFSFHGAMLTTTLSAGIASYPEDGNEMKSIMALADEALFVSKKEGKNRVTLAAPGASGHSLHGKGA
jgi:diguanylate cyclase (GGDEF)-like protein